MMTTLVCNQTGSNHVGLVMYEILVDNCQSGLFRSIVVPQQATTTMKRVVVNSIDRRSFQHLATSPTSLRFRILKFPEI